MILSKKGEVMDTDIKIIKAPAGRSNVYFIKKNDKCVMIDAGYSGLPKIENIAHSNEIELKKINMLILTHTHYDHVNLLYEINKKIYAEILVHQAGEKYLKFGQNPEPKNPTFLGKIVLFLSKFGGYGKFDPVVPDTVIEGEYSTNKFGFEMKIIPTPGHSDDSITILVDKKWAFVGDTLFHLLPNSLYPMFVDDKEQLRKSWKKLLDLKCEYYFPGHGNKISFTTLEKHYNKKKYA